MARGGGRRTYVRDAKGRFASTGGGSSGRSKGGTLGARSSLKKSRSKLASKDPADKSLQGTLSRRSQKGAVTRGNKALKDAKASSRKSLSIGKPGGTIGKRKGLKARPAQPASAPKKAKTRAQKADQAARLASRAASRSQSPALSKEASLRNERRSIRLKERSKQLSKEPKLSRRQKDIALRAKRDYGVKSTASKSRVSARGKVKNTNSEQQASKAVGKMKPLKGVGSVVARNLQGFKGIPVQIRSRKEAAKAYRQRTNQIGKFADGRKELDSRRIVTARSTVQQGTVFGGVKRVPSGPMRPVGERAKDGSIRRSRRSKPAPIIGSKSWRKSAERMMKTGQMDPWVQAQYNRLYGKR